MSSVALSIIFDAITCAFVLPCSKNFFLKALCCSVMSGAGDVIQPEIHSLTNFIPAVLPGPSDHTRERFDL